MSKYLKILHHYSYVPQIRTKGPAVWQTFLQNIPDQTALWNIGYDQQFGPVHQEGGIFILPSWSLKSWGFLICQKPPFWSGGSLKNLTHPPSIKHLSIANLHFLRYEYNFGEGGVQWHFLPLLLSLEHVINSSYYCLWRVCLNPGVEHKLPECALILKHGEFGSLVHIDWQWMPRTKSFQLTPSYVLLLILLIIWIYVVGGEWSAGRWEVGGGAYSSPCVAFCCPPTPLLLPLFGRPPTHFPS